MKYMLVYLYCFFLMYFLIFLNVIFFNNCFGFFFFGKVLLLDGGLNLVSNFCRKFIVVKFE